MKHELHCGDCLEVLKTLPDNSVEAVVTDPPAGISFMGANWDKDKGGRKYWIAWMQQIAAECLRVLKPGGHALVWAIPRTSHWTATAWEDAGFEVRDVVSHVFGSGFPKSHDVSKAIDKAAGFATEAAKQWAGWGSALKPAREDWLLLRKPLIGTIAENVSAHGCGGLNIDSCRIEGGRWPANFCHDGSGEVLELFPEVASNPGPRHNQNASKRIFNLRPNTSYGYSGTGSAARYFYCSKASKKDRDEGLDGFEKRVAGGMSGRADGSMGSVTMSKNTHATVKPTPLMRWLCRLITPPGGTVLDPFMGSGSTGKAAKLEGFNFIGIEREPEYFEIAKARIKYHDR